MSFVATTCTYNTTSSVSLLL